MLTPKPIPTTKTDKLVFRHLPAFAVYIRDNCLVPYIQEQINISREINLPMLRFFEGMTDEQLIAMSTGSHMQFLTNAAENKLKEYFEQSQQLWIDDALGIIKRDEITAEDITLSSYYRKRAMLKFLPGYTNSVDAAIELIKEMDILSVESDTAATNIYINLLRERINEQVHFSESISNTTPGLNYVFDLTDRQIKYGNTNYLDFFGHSLDEMKENGNSIIFSNIHSEDVAGVLQHIERASEAADGEVITFEYRLKNCHGKYVWVREYSSVFKRDMFGGATQIAGLILDIDREKQIAEKLAENEKYLRKANEIAKVGNWTWDMTTNQIAWTETMYSIYELEPETELSFERILSYCPENEREEIRARLDHCIKTLEPCETYYNIVLVNGTKKILHARSEAIADSTGQVCKVIGVIQDVTERQQLVEQLQLNDALFKQAQARTHIGNWTWDIPANKVTWSDEMYRVYGLEPQSEEVNYETYISHIHPDDREDRIRQVQHVFDTGLPEDRHYRIALPDGSIRILHTKSELTYDDEGKPLRMTGTCQDVTDKQMLIEKLQHSEFLYKQAQAISNIGNWVWDMDTKEIEWSDEIYNMHELEIQSLKSSNSLYEFTHPDDLKYIKEAMRNAIEKKEPFDFNYRINLKSGKTKILNAKGEVEIVKGKRKAYGTLQDITRQKQAEKQLQEYKDFIKKITDVTPSIIAAYNIHTGKYSFINEAIEKLLGYPPPLIMEEGLAFLTSLVHPDDLAGIMEKNAKALEEANKLPHGENELIAEFKYRLRNKNGAYRWFHTYGTIFDRNAKGEVENILNISIDITEQEEAEQLLFQKNIQLQQSNTSLEEYAYVASHDLKEPLRKISTFSDRLLTTQPNITDEGKMYLDKIVESSKRMQKMINDLLSVSTILGNKHYQQCDLNEVLAEALQAIDHKIEEDKVLIEATTLPSLSIVRSQFVQLFQNLVGNSLKFMQPGVRPMINVSSRKPLIKTIEDNNLPRNKKYIQLDIKDNGIGFDNQYAAKIFGIFQRLHGKSEYDGTGIGLTVCKKIVENHDGIIFATGVPGEGATFTIIIPT